MEPEGNEVHEQASEPPAEEAAGSTGDIVVELEGFPDVGPRPREAFDCPLCGTQIAVPSRHFTTTIRCRQCKRFVETPPAAVAPPATLDVDLPALPIGVTDSGYTDMEGHAEYQCESCGTRLRQPFPRRCPECHAILGEPLSPEEQTAEATPPVADTPVGPLPELESPPPLPSTIMPLNWKEGLSHVLAWCLGRDTETRRGYIEMPTRDPQGRIQFECASCHSVLPSRLPDACPECGAVFGQGPSPLQPAPHPEPIAGLEPESTRDPVGPAPGLAIPASRIRLAVAGALLLFLVLLGWYASGAPLRATKAAFAKLREADGTKSIVITPDALISAYQTKDSSRRELLTELAKVLGYQAAEDQVGSWVLCGRLVKYASVLGVPRAEMAAAITQLRGQPAEGSDTGIAGRAYDALGTLARRYSSSRGLRRDALKGLADLLGCEPTRAKAKAALDSRYVEIVAWEEDQRQASVRAQQAQQAEARRRQARSAQLERVRNAARRQPSSASAGSRPSWANTGYSPGYTCSRCGGSGVCSHCQGSKVMHRWDPGPPGQYVPEQCTSCYGNGRCGYCGGKGIGPMP